MADGDMADGRVFISHVREDAARADELQELLQDAGARVWRDTADLLPGEDWRMAIRRAISTESLVFLACFSRNSVSRAKMFHNEELALAIDQLRLRNPDEPWLIPVRFDDCQIPDRYLGDGRTLASIQRADLFGSRHDAEAAKLLTAVQRILGRPGPQPASGKRTRRPAVLLARGLAMAAAAVIAAAVIVALPGTTMPPVPEMSPPHPGNASIGAVAFSPSGRILAAGDADGVTYLWNLVSGHRIALRNPDGQSVYAAAFSPDGRTLAVGTANSTFSNGVIYLWNVVARTVIATLHAPDHGQIVGLAFSPDNNLLAAADGRDADFYIWKAQAQHQHAWKAQAQHGPYTIRNLNASTGATAVAFSPDSRLLAATDSAGDIFWWNTRKHSLIATSDDPETRGANGTAFNPVNATLAVADYNGDACLWNAGTRTIIKCLHGQGRQHLQDIAFTPDGKTIIAIADNHRLGEHSIFAWDIATGQLTILHDPHSTGIYALAASPRSRTLAAGDWNGHVYLWKI